MAKYQDASGNVTEISSPELNPTLIAGKTQVADNVPIGANPSPTIDASAINPNVSFTLPSLKPNSNYDIGSIDSNIGAIQNATSPAEEKQKTLSQKLLDSVKSLSGKTAAQQTAEEQAGLPGYRTQLTDINNQLQTLQKESSAIPLQIQEQFKGRGATIGGVQEIQAGQTRLNAIKALGLSAIGQTLQGNIALAQQQADKAVALQFEPIQNEIDYLKTALQINSDQLTREDKKRAEALQINLAERQRLLDNQKEDMKTKLGFAAEASKNGAPQLIVQNAIDAKTPQEALGLLSPYFQDTTAKQQALLNLEKTRAEIKNLNTKTGSAPVQGYNGEFAATIATAAQLLPSTKAKQSSENLQTFIAQKDYKSAYNEIANNVEDTLTGTNKTRFSAARTDIQVMQGLQKAIQDYSNTPGANLSYLKGSADEIAKRFGQLATDPKFAALGIELQREFQTYRNEMTGAVFSPTESAEYAKVNPRTSASLDLNLATVSGALAQLNNRVESTINARVPSAQYIKEYANGTNQQAPAQKQILYQGKIYNVDANGNMTPA